MLLIQIQKIKMMEQMFQDNLMVDYDFLMLFYSLHRNKPLPQLHIQKLFQLLMTGKSFLQNIDTKYS